MLMTMKWMTAGVAVFLGGHSAYNPAPGAQPAVPAVIQQLESATVRINGRNVLVDVAAWRNLMPPVDRRSDTLIASVQLSTAHPQGLPPIGSVSMKLYQGTRTWASPLTPLPTFVSDPNSAGFVARGGPRLSVGSHAQVRLDIVSGSTRTTVTIPVRIGAAY